MVAAREDPGADGALLGTIWRGVEVFQSRPPVSPDYLAVAGMSEGDLSQRAHDRAATLGVDVDLRLRAPRKFWRELAQARGPVRDARLPSFGSTLVRQYRDQTIQVTILADGFEYDGKIYDSLSSIESSVTGTRWNGFSFFGLNKKGAG